MLHVTFVAPIICRWHPDVRKICILIYIKTKENILIVFAIYENFCNTLFYVRIYTMLKNFGFRICSTIRHCR